MTDVARPLLLSAALAGAGKYARELYRVRAQVGAHREAWLRHNRLAWQKLSDQSSPRPLVLLALGDSATQGVGARSIGEGYIPQLARVTERKMGKPCIVLNLSVSGATVNSVLAQQIPRLKELAIKPDLLVANIGGNDVNVRGLNAVEFRRQVRELAGELSAPALVGNIPSFSFLPQDSRATEFSAILDEEVKAQGHAAVDLRTLSQSYSTADYLLRYHAADLFHPNWRAYRAWSVHFGAQLPDALAA